MFRSYILTLGLILALSAGVEAQERQHRSSDQGPIATLLRMRAELRLSPDQIVQLQRIDSETDQLNRPYVATIRQIRSRVRALGPPDRFTPDKEAQFDAYMAEARPHMDRIAQNNFAAMHRVGRVLSKWQKERMQELLRNTGPNRERSSNHPPPNGSGQ